MGEVSSCRSAIINYVFETDASPPAHAAIHVPNPGTKRFIRTDTPATNFDTNGISVTKPQTNRSVLSTIITFYEK